MVENQSRDRQRKISRQNLRTTRKDYATKIEEDFNDALVKALASEKFTSDFAEQNYQLVIKKGLKREVRKILGLDDYMNELRKSHRKMHLHRQDAQKVPTFLLQTKVEEMVRLSVHHQQYGSHAIERFINQR